MATSKVISSSRPADDAVPKGENSKDNSLEDHNNEPEKIADPGEDHHMIPPADENIVPDIPPPMVVYHSSPDVSAYQQNKTLAQGMMDMALLSANANQLRFILETQKDHPYFYSSLTFIAASIVIQIAVAFGLVLNGRYNINRENQVTMANRVNNLTTIGIFIITVINVFVSAFAAVESKTKGSTKCD